MGNACFRLPEYGKSSLGVIPKDVRPDGWMGLSPSVKNTCLVSSQRMCILMVFVPVVLD